MNRLITTYKIAVVAFIVIVAGGAVWAYAELRQALCAKYARVWMHDVLWVAERIERFHDLHGRYPVAFNNIEALRAELGADYPETNVLSDGLLKYFSDGTSYVVLLRPGGDGPNPVGVYTFEFGDGRWKSWPGCLAADKVPRLAVSEVIEDGNDASQSNNRLKLTFTSLACARAAPAA